MVCSMLRMVQKRCRWGLICLCLPALTLLTVAWIFTKNPTVPHSARAALGSPVQIDQALGADAYSKAEQQSNQSALKQGPGSISGVQDITSSVRTVRLTCELSNPSSNRVGTFLKVCQDLGLDTFLAEPDLLRDIQKDSGTVSPCVWAHKQVVTFGVIDPLNETMKQLSERFDNETDFHQAIHNVDSRNATAASFAKNKTLPTIPMHFLWWSRDREQAHSVSVLHLVVFRSRGRYLWHSQLSASQNNTALRKLPVSVSKLSLGQHAVLMNRFTTRKLSVGGVNVSLPTTIPSFLRSLRDDEIVECNHTLARHLVAHYPNISTTVKGPFREKIKNVISKVKTTLDKLGLTFWIASGTFLGWYRHCDVIPFTSDVDIEMKIEDYSPAIVGELKAAGLKPFRQLGKVTDMFELTFRMGINLDIFFAHEEKNHTWWGLFDQASYKKYRLIFPKFTLKWADFHGLKVRVPYPPEPYLEAHYGKNWAVPNKGYHWLNSPPNRKFVGVWPANERAGLKKYF